MTNGIMKTIPLQFSEQHFPQRNNKVFFSWVKKKTKTKGNILQKKNYGHKKTYNINFNFLNLETKNNRPYQTQDEAGIAINNIFSTDRLQTDLQ